VRLASKIRSEDDRLSFRPIGVDIFLNSCPYLKGAVLRAFRLKNDDARMTNLRFIAAPLRMSANWHKADIGLRGLNLCFGGKAGIIRT